MARHGENIRKRNDGRWEARYQIFDMEKGRKIYRSVYGPTYEIVKEKRDAVVHAAEKGTGQAKGQASHREEKACTQILFSQAADEWLKEVSDKCKYSTYVKYGTVYKKYLKESLGICLLSDIQDPELPKRLSDCLSGEDMSDSIRKSIYCIANQILIFAEGKYSVCVPVLKSSGIKPMKKPVKTFSKAEQSRLLACIDKRQDKYMIAVLLCLYTGMRLGELCALKWTDFDFQDGTVTVNRTVQRITVAGSMTKTILMETDPKSECSKRTVPLTDDMIRILKGIRKEGDYVFNKDRPLEPRTMQYRFKKALKYAGVDDRDFHALRHTFATNCVENHMDVKTLSIILGHSDVKITLNRYVHPTMDSQRRQIGRLPDFYGQIRGQTT